MTLLRDFHIYTIPGGALVFLFKQHLQVHMHLLFHTFNQVTCADCHVYIYTCPYLPVIVSTPVIFYCQVSPRPNTCKHGISTRTTEAVVVVGVRRSVGSLLADLI